MITHPSFLLLISKKDAAFQKSSISALADNKVLTSFVYTRDRHRDFWLHYEQCNTNSCCNIHPFEITTSPFQATRRLITYILNMHKYCSYMLNGCQTFLQCSSTKDDKLVVQSVSCVWVRGASDAGRQTRLVYKGSQHGTLWFEYSTAFMYIKSYGL